MAFNGEIYEIFSWLPAKTLHKFSTAAKPCLDYLSDFSFLEKQCRNSQLKPEEYLMVQDDHSPLHGRPNQFLLCPLTDDENSSSFGKGYIHRKSLRRVTSKGRVLASSNGLLLCRNITNYSMSLRAHLFLCNPATKTWLRIKLPRKDIAKSYATNMVNVVLLTTGKSFPLDYKLILFEADTSSHWSSPYIVHAFEQGKWVRKEKGLYTGTRSVDFEHPVHCTDGLYLLSDTANYVKRNSTYYLPYIVLYDIRHGTSKTYALPREATRNFASHDCSMRIFGWGKSEENPHCFESLCLVKSEGSYISIWIADVGNKGKKSPWYKLVEVNIARDFGIEECDLPYKLSFIVIGKNLIFTTRSNIYSYCLEGKDYGKLRKICSFDDDGDVRFRLAAYSSTLRPCIRSLEKPPLRLR